MQTEHWMLSWVAQPECHHLQWIWGVGMSMKQVSCSPEPNRLVTMLIVCKTLLRSPSTVQPFGAWYNIPWPDWTRCPYWLYLFPAVFISFWSTNGSFWHCLGSHVKYFIVLTSRRKKKNNKCPVPHTDSSKSKGSHVLVVFYSLCVLKSFSVCILWNAFLHHASSMLLSLPPSCFQL